MAAPWHRPAGGERASLPIKSKSALTAMLAEKRAPPSPLRAPRAGKPRPVRFGRGSAAEESDSLSSPDDDELMGSVVLPPGAGAREGARSPLVVGHACASAAGDDAGASRPGSSLSAASDSGSSVFALDRVVGDRAATDWGEDGGIPSVHLCRTRAPRSRRRGPALPPVNNFSPLPSAGGHWPPSAPATPRAEDASAYVPVHCHHCHASFVPDASKPSSHWSRRFCSGECHVCSGFEAERARETAAARAELDSM